MNARDGNFFECNGRVHTDAAELVKLVKGRDLVLQHRVEMFFMQGFRVGDNRLVRPADRNEVVVKDCRGKSFTFKRLGQLGRLDHPLHNKFKPQFEKFLM